MKEVTGIIGSSLANGLIDLHVRRVGGEEIRWTGVAILDDQSKPIDTWGRALAFVRWRNIIREKVKQMTDREILMLALSGERPEDHAPRIGVLEFWVDGGGSRTAYVEPDDEVILCRNHVSPWNESEFKVPVSEVIYAVRP